MGALGYVTTRNYTVARKDLHRIIHDGFCFTEREARELTEISVALAKGYLPTPAQNKLMDRLLVEKVME